MKQFTVVAFVCVIGSAARSDGDPRYLDPKAVIAGLRELAETCAVMADKSTQEEIFGLTIRKDGDTCYLGRGDVDENVVEFFRDNPIDWAGMDGDEGLWVSIPD